MVRPGEVMFGFACLIVLVACASGYPSMYRSVRVPPFFSPQNDYVLSMSDYYNNPGKRSGNGIFLSNRGYYGGSYLNGGYPSAHSQRYNVPYFGGYGKRSDSQFDDAIEDTEPQYILVDEQ